MENVKAMGLMAQVAKGLLNHSGSATAAQLGDRSKYVGLSDIGKGAECMRAAVANKVFGSHQRLMILVFGIEIRSMIRSWLL